MMNIKSIIFDNDGTLYEMKEDYMDMVVGNLVKRISEEIGFPEDDVMSMRKELIAKYGIESTAYVFGREYGFNIKEMIERMAESANMDYFSRDERLCRLLKQIELPKSVLTNNSSQYASRALEKMGALPFFEQIIGSLELDFCFKPDKEAFERAFEITGYRPESSMFIDDTMENVAAAEEMGMTGVYLNRQGETSPDADYSISTIYELSEVIE